MKITVTVDCTPEEARGFLGLPDIGALQREMTKAMEDHMRKQFSGDPEAAMKAWFGTGLQGLTDMQRDYWQQFFKKGG
jgi:hypothetical protein